MNFKKFFSFIFFTLFSINGFSQAIQRERPKEWDSLVPGARFIDLFLPMEGKVLSSDTWGTDSVVPRFTDNGIEDRIWSYWGGNIVKGEDGKYHLFVCGWLESSEKGHREWPNSHVFNAVSDNLSGPYMLRNMIGKGHNPEVFQLKDGRYVLYVIDGRYVTDDINRKWEYGKFEFNPRGRKIIEGLSNLSFVQREDGSVLMVCRGGGIWISQDGLSPYNQITDKRVYPDVDGRFEDPVIWRDNVQYHMIVNDWYGRIAYHLRSKDGLKWVVDPGEAYAPGIAVHKDGTIEDWFKYERIKIYQDEYGRAIQANFAVIDTIKWEDKAFDNHSSKNISIPINPGLLLSVLNPEPITPKTKTIQLKIQAEKGFDPQTEIDRNTLRFGAPTEVDYGYGSKALKMEKSGKDVIVTFDGNGNGITNEEFVFKLIGKSNEGKLLFGYARLPGVEYIEPLLSAEAPVFAETQNGLDCAVEINNFGQVTSGEASVKLEYKSGEKWIQLGSGKIQGLKPYERTVVTFPTLKNTFEKEVNYEFLITIYSGKNILSTFTTMQKVK